MTNISDFKNVTDSLEIYPSELGVVMLDLEPIANPGMPKDWEYNSPDPEQWYVKGWVGQNAHVSLLYGLLRPTSEWEKQIKALLSDLPLPTVQVFNAVSFYHPGDPYSAIVLKADVSEELMEFHRRLAYLPHIDTFTPWVPHVTVAYVYEQYIDDAVALANQMLSGQTLAPIALNLGDKER